MHHSDKRHGDGRKFQSREQKQIITNMASLFAQKRTEDATRDGYCPHLLAFLQGTIVRYKQSADGELEEDTKRTSIVACLRGQEHLLRMIWTWVCEEWWDLHLERSYQRLTKTPGDIPVLKHWHPKPLREQFEAGELDELHDGDEESHQFYGKERQEKAGCPAAVVASDVVFPAPVKVPMGTFANQVSEHLYVNMMPFELHNKESLPVCCQQYWDIILTCIRRIQNRRTKTKAIAYLTIDERPVAAGEAHRRPGLHVESPGILRLTDGITEKIHGSFIPGVPDHRWGQGMMMRDERMQGGIFIGSNVDDSCAVWNVRVYDPAGEVVRAHGDLEHCRSLLGPGRKLRAGEIVWMTDKTPHESVPLVHGAHRQFFRLVVGDISAWFADHCTANPLGRYLPSEVRVVHGNKFDIGKGTVTGMGMSTGHIGHSWYAGDSEELKKKEEEAELRAFLIEEGLGHLIGAILKANIRSLRTFTKAAFPFDSILSVLSDDGRREFGSNYYEYPQLCDARLNAARFL